MKNIKPQINIVSCNAECIWVKRLLFLPIPIWICFAICFFLTEMCAANPTDPWAPNRSCIKLLSELGMSYIRFPTAERALPTSEFKRSLNQRLLGLINIIRDPNSSPQIRAITEGEFSEILTGQLFPSALQITRTLSHENSPDVHIALDYINETIFRTVLAIRSGGGYRPELGTPVTSYARVILKNLHTDNLRQLQRPQGFLRRGQTLIGLLRSIIQQTPSRYPLRVALRSDLDGQWNQQIHATVEAMHRAVNSLEEDQRELLRLSYFESMTLESLTLVYNQDIARVWRNRNKAVEALADNLRDQGVDGNRIDELSVHIPWTSLFAAATTPASQNRRQYAEILARLPVAQVHLLHCRDVRRWEFDRIATEVGESQQNIEDAYRSARAAVDHQLSLLGLDYLSFVPGAFGTPLNSSPSTIDSNQPRIIPYSVESD